VAKSTPGPEGLCVSFTTSVVGVADTTFPFTPPSKATRLWPAWRSKPVPKSVMRSADCARPALLDDTVGAATTACGRRNVSTGGDTTAGSPDSGSESFATDNAMRDSRD